MHHLTFAVVILLAALSPSCKGEAPTPPAAKAAESATPTVAVEPTAPASTLTAISTSTSTSRRGNTDTSTTTEISIGGGGDNRIDVDRKAGTIQIESTTIKTAPSGGVTVIHDGAATTVGAPHDGSTVSKKIGHVTVTTEADANSKSTTIKYRK